MRLRDASALMLVAGALASCARSSPPATSPQAPIPTTEAATPRPRPARVLATTEAFARRFALPVTCHAALDAGLAALAIEIESPGALLGECTFHLLVDPELPLALPDGGPTGLGDVFAGEGPLFFALRLDDADARWLQRRLDGLTGIVMLRSASYDAEAGRGIHEDPPLLSWRDEILPGLRHLAFTVLSDDLDPARGPLDVWLRRDGTPEAALDAGAPDPASLVRFRVPPPVQVSAWRLTRGDDPGPVLEVGDGTLVCPTP